MSTLYDHTGVIDIHVAYSFDGRTPVPDILKAAQMNHLDFIMLVNHSNLRAREEGFEGWHGDALLIIGQEIAPSFNHYIAFRTREPVIAPGDKMDLDPQRYIDQVRAQEEIGFIAIPTTRNKKMFHVKHFPCLFFSLLSSSGDRKRKRSNAGIN